jgi:Domain of unknown function (DUF4296)
MKKMKYTPSLVMHFALTFALFLTILSCQKEKVQLPIPKETMVSVLVDIHMSEAYVEGVNTTLKDSMSKIYYPQIFKHHGITAKLYDSTFSILSNKPDLMKSVYDDVLLKLEERQKIMRGDTLNPVKK